jgi:hypothetical protein
VFRSGQIESLYAELISVNDDKIKTISFGYYEQEILKAIQRYCLFLQGLSILAPYIILISMTGVSGAVVHELPRTGGYSRSLTIQQDTILLPDVLIEDNTVLIDKKRIAQALKPVFDIVWNAGGYPRSINFDKNGNWAPPI